MTTHRGARFSGAVDGYIVGCILSGMTLSDDVNPWWWGLAFVCVAASAWGVWLEEGKRT